MPLFCEIFIIAEKLSFGIHKKRAEKNIIKPKTADKIPNIVNKSVLSSQSNIEYSLIPYIIYTLGFMVIIMLDRTDMIITPSSKDFIKSIENNRYAIFINTNEPVNIDKVAGNLALIYMLNFQFPVIMFDDCEVVLKLLNRSEEIVNTVSDIFNEIEEPTKSDFKRIVSEFVDSESCGYYEDFFNVKPEEGVSIIWLDFGFVIIKGETSVNSWVNFIFFIKEKGKNGKLNIVEGFVPAFNEWNNKNVDPNLN